MSTKTKKSEQVGTAKNWLTDDEKKIIRKQFFPASATDIEMKYCMKVAESLRLNPILNQIFFVERKSNSNGKWITKVEPMAGRDSYLLLAHNSGQFDGLKSVSGLSQKPTLIDDKWIIVEDLSAMATVKIKDSDNVFEVTVYYSEYVQLKKDGTPNKFWKEKPITMLKKVAESQVLRKAFNISGLYGDAEISSHPDPAKMYLEKSLNNLKESTPKTIDIEAEVMSEVEEPKAIKGVTPEPF